MCVKRYRNSVGPWNKSTDSWLMYKEAVRFWTSTNRAGCVVFFSLQSALGPPPHLPYLFKMTSLIWWFWLQVPERCLGRLSAQPKPHLLARAQRSGVLLSPGLPLLDGRRCVSSAHAPSSSLSISCAFSPSNKPFGWNRFYARSKNNYCRNEQKSPSKSPGCGRVSFIDCSGST